LWGDEGDTALYAIQPDFQAWVQYLTQDKIPDCQMPLSMLTAWLTARSLGSAEWQLRAINVFWGACALVAMFYAGKAVGCRWLPLLLAIQPYYWFYTNEARPYAAELCAGALLLLGVALFWRQQGQGLRWALVLTAGAVLLGYTTMLAPFPLFGVALLCALTAVGAGWQPAKKAYLPFALGLLLLLPIGAYYLWTIQRGVTFPVIWKADWKGFGYVFYEFTGLSGLGPSIMEIREGTQAGSLAAVLKRHVPELALAAVAGGCWLGILVLAVRRLVREGRWHLFALLLAIPLLTGGTLSVVGLLMKKMLWARHWAPLFPFYVAALGLALQALTTSGGVSRRLNRLVAGAWLVLMLFSALNFRFADKHRKDDYRATVTLAKQYLASGHPVWWAASWHCAVYYGLPIESAQKTASISPMCYQLKPVNSAGAAPGTQVIFLSRPSVYDPAGSLRAYAAQNHLRCEEDRCRAFWIYQPTSSTGTR
jgi:hypothetical protein